VNLRKDHCRDLPGRTTREPVTKPTAGVSAPACAGGGREGVPRPSALPGPNNEPRRKTRQGTPTERARPRGPGNGARAGRVFLLYEPKRLSATDISALASMKNVAKCDTWCELQNPVNHRVFERKLRPRPRPRARLPGRHATSPPPSSPPRGHGGGGGEWPPARSRSRSAQKRVPRRRAPRQAVVERPSENRREHPSRTGTPAAPTRPSADAPLATPGQAGSPAEFKHINKRRKRNLPGFP
jgi:hypothetical protein